MLNRKHWILIFLTIGISIPTVFNGCSEGGFESSVTNTALNNSHGNGPEDDKVPDDDRTPDEDDDVDPPVQPPVEPPVEPPVIPPVVVPPPPTMKAAFVAVGHYKSSMYTCDGGATWKGYRSLNNSFRCWQPSSNNFDCDHHSSSSMGLTYGPQGFLATFGWGQPGNVEMTENGTTWDPVQQGNTWAGVAYGNNTYILHERDSRKSINGGETWQAGGYIDYVPYNARQLFFVPQSGGVFIGTAESSNVLDMMISRNNGQTWQHPTTRPAGCGPGLLAYSANRIVLLSRSLCVSTDAGATWQEHPNKPNAEGLIYDGTEFKAYDTGVVRRSTDGITWTSTTVRINGVNSASTHIGKVAYHPESKAYVGIRQSWDNYYEATQYYTSLDGLNWIQLNKQSGAAPTAPHPINHISAGYLKECQ